MNDPWKVLNLELEKGVPSLPREAGVGGLFVIFWSNGIALGHQIIEPEQLPMPASQVEQLVLQTITPAVGNHLFAHGFEAPLPATPLHDEPTPLDAILATKRPLAALQEQHGEAARTPHAETISVVICTRERPDDLKRCLAALDGLSLRPQQIVVVDNAPQSDATRRVVEGTPDVEYVLEPQPGLSYARNAGIARCRGDIVAFTDDDVEVHSGWLWGVLNGFNAPDVMAVTGPVLPAELKTEAQILFQRSHQNSGWGYHRLLFDAAFFTYTQPRGAPVWHIGAGANMAFRRQVFEQSGGFDERLGAGASGCSEDSEMWYRVLAEGGACRYEPTAVVFHFHRRDLDSLNHQMHQYLQGHVAALLAQWERYGHRGNLRRAYLTLPLWYGHQTLHWLLRRGKPRPSTLGAEILGAAAGTKFYWRERLLRRKSGQACHKET